ncbi:response regulator [Methanospirillum purgamenti]|jgi:CheY-like chemotaxis protein|uniref:Response regulator n=1 Tax=Methanospirillum hungatei TaxID=2203 RepID=A0A8F5VR82_METHU|nr:response regulator [Methanospirillum hungatei]QXO95898.1 response regulator [Methanospirillum hungatei]
MFESQKKSKSEILVVEDDEIIATLIERFLIQYNYTVCAKVASGEDALYKTAEHLPDLVLMDINLAGKIDGITATKFIASIFHTPVIFLSGQDDDTTLERAALAEPASFIIKPFTAKDLYSNIEIALHRERIFKRSKDYQEDKIKRLARAALSDLDAYFILDIRGRIIFINPYGEYLLNVQRNDIILKPIGNFLTFYDTRQKIVFSDTFLDVIRESLVLGIRQHIAVKMKDETYRHVIIQSTHIRNASKESIGMIVRMHIKTKSEL